MKKEMASIIIAITVIFIINSCNKKDVQPDCKGTIPTYHSEIKAIMDKSCSSCHGSSSSKNFTNYQGLKPYLDNGKFKNEVLVKQTMPKGLNKLSQDELNRIQCWVNNGYPEN